MNNTPQDAGAPSGAPDAVQELRLYQAELEMQNEELRTAYQKLETSRRKYLGLFDLAPVGFVTTDVNGTIQDINLAACRLFGVVRQHITSGKTPLVGLLGGECHAACYDALDRLAGRERSVQLELRSSGLHEPVRLIEATATVQVESDDSRVILFSLLDITARRRAEDQARNRLQAMENSPASIVITNRNAEIEYVNPKFLEVTGYTREEVIGRNPRVLKSGEMSPEGYRTMWTTLLAGQIWQGEFHNKRKDGSLYWELASISPMMDEHGHITHFVAVKEDITERKKAENRLRLFSRRAMCLLQLHTLEQNQDEFTFLQSVLGFCEELTGSSIGFAHMINEDQATIELVAWSKSTLESYCRASFDRHYPIAEAGLWARAYHERRVVVVNDYASDPHHRGLPDGHASLIRLMSMPVISDQRVRMLVGVGNKPSPYDEVDIETVQLLINEAWRIIDQRRSEQLLQRSEELLDETGQAAGVGGWEVNLLTNELRWTKQTYRIHDLPLDYRPTVEKALEFYDPEDREVLVQAIEEAKRTGKPYHLELPFTSSTGRRLWVRTIGQARFEDGKAVKLLGAFQDVTERKKAEQERLKLSEQLAQAQKMESVGLLAGGIAHEFNNKLQAILGFTEMASMNAGVASPLMQELMEIQRAAQQSAELTRQLLAYASKQLVSPQRIHLGRTIKGMLRMIGQVLGENIEVTFAAAPEVVPVRIDPNQVDQILTNLVLNARDAMQGRGRMAIEVSNARFEPGDPCLPLEVAPGEFACLAVRDEGTGIPEEIIDQIFEPFFTTKPQGKGTGLGLPTVYGIARQNGGFVTVDSEVGEGTTMRVFLPRDRVPESPVEPEAPLPRAVGGPEVLLVVDDEPAVLKMMVRGLTGLGYQVHAACCGEDAAKLAKAYDGTLRLLLTDVMMPGESGVELYRRLLPEHPGLKVLYISGHADDVLGPQGVIDPGTPFVAKPFTIRTLNERIRAMLDQPA